MSYTGKGFQCPRLSGPWWIGLSREGGIPSEAEAEAALQDYGARLDLDSDSDPESGCWSAWIPAAWAACLRRDGYLSIQLVSGLDLNAEID